MVDKVGKSTSTETLPFVGENGVERCLKNIRINDNLIYENGIPTVSTVRNYFLHFKNNPR